MGNNSTLAPTEREARERFAANVERSRRREGLSIEGLAERSDVDPGELREILEAEREAPYGTIAALAGALGAAVGDLFEGIRRTRPGG